MPTKKKLYEKIKQNPTNVTYEELKSLVLSCGYELRKGGGGSHRWFRQEGYPPIHFPEHRPVGKVYVKEILGILEKYFNLDDL